MNFVSFSYKRPSNDSSAICLKTELMLLLHIGVLRVLQSSNFVIIIKSSYCSYHVIQIGKRIEFSIVLFLQMKTTI